MKVGVIMGGTSSERGVSLKTGAEMLRGLEQAKYEAVPVVVDRRENLADQVRGLDFALLALHGEFGEDGTVQAVLETLGIPYSGSGVLSSAICMDKDMTKRLLRSSGIPTADWLCLENSGEYSAEAASKLGFPLIVKPSSGGSSIGMSKVKELEELYPAVTEAFRQEQPVMLEAFVKGMELTCSILDGEVLPILRIVPNHAEWFDYNAKYSAGGALEEVADLPPELESRVKETALACWRALKCGVYARVDVIVSNGVPYVLEVNTLPGMTSASLLPKSAKAAGMTFSGLLETIISLSLKERGVPQHVS
ncbi:D-alanine--D-alanine ligase [Paenibacillus sp. HN-1]|uniref:D-alanine--D-alanine ligase n=1 Tax=Paenibacillus TaxID=44249 RepID=UPI001CA83D43|nr:MULTISPECIES: D-alanine--D-alanine ligase [Paenibacillus]MBY9080909.1 D-alanine--D-alanine ligase [Paenibacillus sp. CGMCC 1.18879]MBY9085099.1 D-alanine--D-alanine ligase [Paenibacillus sinensis]